MLLMLPYFHHARESILCKSFPRSCSCAKTAKMMKLITVYRLTTMALSEWVARGLVDDVKKEEDVESRARL